MRRCMPVTTHLPSVACHQAPLELAPPSPLRAPIAPSQLHRIHPPQNFPQPHPLLSQSKTPRMFSHLCLLPRPQWTASVHAYVFFSAVLSIFSKCLFSPGCISAPILWHSTASPFLLCTLTLPRTSVHQCTVFSTLGVGLWAKKLLSW